ncbi:hypothetical protein I8J29_01840 [Paenibacillus sp. MWE-103]|uniref:DUF21 domain-containing protein n=1 Tax=Paenibacillus artemisiicola TaxID=1172618 RepID=A0ABS3W3N8_9BACL|nr:hypothetical protein [Paenibacillus artemisiicola]MBO7742920.1 hypothetical protein [Paenibacillus artemisiicola]
MKIVFVYVLLFAIELAFLVTADLLSGIPIPEALQTLRKAFSVLKPAHAVFLFVLLCLPLRYAFAAKARRGTDRG